MRRLLVGVFDPAARAGLRDPAAAVAPEPAETLTRPPLRLACCGPAPVAVDGVICLLDGNLDNAAELQAELGVEASSAEQLLALAFRRWGDGVAERMRGAFALLLWDEARCEGLIARDQLGLRPLFVREREGALVFASQVHHLLALLPRRPKPDATSLVHWLTAGSQPGRRTLFDGVRRLGPGEMLLIGDASVRERTYWRPRFEAPLDLPPADVAPRLRGALDNAVSRQLDASRPTGVLMSGGLDSSSLAALAASQARGGVLAYSGTFPDHPAVDEAELIAELRSSIDLPGATAEARPGGMVASALEHLASWQLPPLGWGDFWSLPLAHAAREDGVLTILDGTGGDELFGPFSYLLADRLLAARPREVLELAYGLPGGGPHVPRRQVAAAIASLAFAGALPHRLQRPLQAVIERRRAPTWLQPESARELVDSDDQLAWKRLDGPRWWARAAHAVTREIEASGVFEHQGRWAAAAELEVRMPLLDLDLVELALRQPPSATFDRRFSRPLLRAALVGSLPDSVRLRPNKAWFDTLIVDCLSGPDRDAVRRLLGDPNAQIGAIVDLAKVRSTFLDSDRLRRSEPLVWMSQLWRLVTAELWLRSQSTSVAELERVLEPSRPRVTVHAASYLSSP